MNKFRAITSGWWGVLREAAYTLFIITLTLDVVLFGIKIALNRTHLYETVSEFVMILLFAGLIAAVINNYQEWMVNGIYQGLLNFGNSLGSFNVDPSDPFRQCVAVVDTLLFIAQDLTGIDNFVSSLMVNFTALILMIAFIIIAAFMVLLNIEFMVLGTLGLLFIGLGGSKLFKEYAFNVMKYVFSIAVKLFVLQAVVKIGMEIFMSMNFVNLIAAGGEGLFGNLLVCVACAALILVLSLTMPNAAGNLLSGAHVGGANPIVSAAKYAGSAAVGATIAAGKGVFRGANSVRLAHNAAKADPSMGTAGRLMEARSATKASNPSSIQSQLHRQVREAQTSRGSKEASSAGAKEVNDAGPKPSYKT
jgi:type IV secretion system protein TrbL